MADSSFRNYSRIHVQFYNTNVSMLLDSALTATNRSARKFSLLDLGCGDGGVIFALHKKGLLENAHEIVGVDISEDRIERLKSNLPFVKGIVADAVDVKRLSGSSFDFAICAQLIEHVQNEQGLITEIARLVKPGGFAYLSSVVKRRCGVYIYFKQGSFRLDPTHLREFSSEKELLDLLTKERFEIVRAETHPIEFPLPELLLRLSIVSGLTKPDTEFFQKHKRLSRLRTLRLRVPGYDTVEVLARKPKERHS
jgi:2-polyprenyl-3-methyl-5-hydroxy-6-metoxy-1,4-benzoquinol methylase